MVSICSVPAGLVTAPSEVGGIAGAVSDGRGAETDRGYRQVGGVLARPRIAEGQRIAAGAARRGCAIPPPLRVSVGVPPATVTASLKLTVSVTTLPAARSPAPAVMPVPDATTDATVGVVVSICSVPAELVTAPVRLAALPAPSLTVAVPRLTAVTASRRCSGRFPPYSGRMNALLPEPPV